jgi:hypothetical protein
MITSINPTHLNKPDSNRLASNGVFISNNMSYEQSKYILFISTTIKGKSLKEAFVLLNKQNPNQCLTKYPTICFGRTATSIWFSSGDLTQQASHSELLAAIYF